MAVKAPRKRRCVPWWVDCVMLAPAPDPPPSAPLSPPGRIVGPPARECAVDRLDPDRHLDVVHVPPRCEFELAAAPALLGETDRGVQADGAAVVGENPQADLLDHLAGRGPVQEGGDQGPADAAASPGLGHAEPEVAVVGHAPAGMILEEQVPDDRPLALPAGVQGEQAEPAWALGEVAEDLGLLLLGLVVLV